MTQVTIPKEGIAIAATYLRKLCSGCGGRVERTRPQTHVVSKFTGAVYCATCAVHGLPAMEDRPEGGEHEMSEQTHTESSEDGLMVDLLEAVKAIDGVELTSDSRPLTVKHGKKILGYVTGKRGIRVGFPTRKGERSSMYVNEKGDVEKAVKEMETFIPPLEREAKPDPKPAKAKASTTKKGSTKSTVAKDLSKMTQMINAGIAEGMRQSEVKPDPKPSQKAKAKEAEPVEA